ncbi:hypothetical protein RD055328_02480 [Companilactobacillus sp. RD055328]|uniref:DUF72 domain-containing protein n=1 Tax=Companilactobacillus sp. RD055328 TaxID=2916634 RepID=UPI001FC83E34|nr:DUF72 domain-containing protein [Companilactobacillus sp. RD055328]GKQ42325.1 hypothetical protein RD055328_02480 [Companilactobacillus sp. RD055328]
MIKVGLTNWAKHPDLLDKKNIGLADYEKFYACVEVDSFFYGIKDASVVKKWHDQVDDDFEFVIKASKEITRQSEVSNDTVKKECTKLIESLKPMKHKLTGVLLQFPAFFEVDKENIIHLRNVFEYLKQLPLIVEFRHQSWYEEAYYKRTVNLMREYNVTLAMIDEPQVGSGAVPFDIAITNNRLAFFRFHGRNTIGWKTPTGFESGARTNYCYSTNELEELAQSVKEVSKKVQNTIVIFNNNGGLDANKNAVEFQKILGLEFKTKPSEQISLL